MKHTTMIVMLLLALTSATTSLHAQTQITSCNSEFMDVGGDSDTYLDNENSDWLICPDTLTEFLELEFTHVNIEASIDDGVDSTGCNDVLYIYDGMDDTAPMIGSYCGEESGSGKDANLPGHTLRVGDRFKPTNSSGCFYIKFISNNNNRLSGWSANVNCCVPTLEDGITDGADLPLPTNGGHLFDIEIDNSCVRPGKLNMFTEFEGAGSACFTAGLSQPNRSFYAFNSNNTGGFVELLAAPIDSVGIIEVLVFGPVILDSLSYTGGVINDCVTGENPWSTFFNAGPDQTYILAIATELAGRTSVNALSSSQGLGGVLPVAMQDYDIEKKDKQAIITWTTASEINNEGFEIFRSINNQKFESIGWVESKSGSRTNNNYSFYDEPRTAGDVYYFIRQRDLNGDYTDYDVLQVEFEGDRTVQVYPNPSNGLVSISFGTSQFNKESLILVYDQVGMLKYSTKTEENNKLDLQHLESGLYTIQIINNGVVTNHQHFIRK